MDDDLRRSHARYRSLVESTAMDVWRADATGSLTGDMPEWRARTGQALDDVVGNGWLDAIHPDHRDRVAALWDAAVRTGEPYEAEYPIRDGAGGWRTVVARGTPVRDDDGTIREWVGTSDDITSLREAEARLREESRAVETLREIGAALSASLDLKSLVQTLTDATTRLTGAQFGAFFYNTVDAAGESFLLYTLSGAPIEAFERFGLPRNTRIFAPTFAGEAPVRIDDVRRDQRYGHNPPHNGMPKGHLPVCSYLAVPVVSRTGEVHGGLFFGHEDVGVFTERHERLVVGVAAQAAIAIDNARLYEAERAARTDAEAAQAKLQFLATAGELLGSTLDLDQAVSRLATIAVPTLADWSAVHVVDDNGHLQLAAVFHRDSQEQRRLRESLPPESAADVVESGQPVPLDVAPGVCVPLRARGRVIGALTLARETRPAPDAAEMRLIEELASRAALAVDNAALYSRERRAALTLQRSLLPRAVPPLASGSCAVRYLPGAAGAEVGGDWYDVVPVSGDRVVVVVGDVMGRGVGAAAVMGQLRSAVRAYALDDHEPAEVLHRVDRMVTTLDEPALTTVIIVRYDSATGEALIATAGHLPPLLVAPDGKTSYVESDPGMPLGVGGAEFVQTRVQLDPGARLVLYTDGLVEDPSSSVDEGLERLCAAAAEAVEQRLDAEAFADALLGAMRPGFEHDDDIALLVFAVHDHAPAASPEELTPTDREAWVTLEARPDSVRDARRTVARAVDVWSLPDVSDVAVLLTSELATNAVRHAAGDLRLRVVRRPGGLRVEVHDRDATTLPALRVRNPDGSDDLAESGRGLQFVAELSTRWGVETLAGGKQVWFELDTGA
ncbi:MAG TPA: SpoIIE family protein phosphatase [Frankiaceae bacterium]|jgi:PAS domain S-box-containing protein|nr:SpoIIE family protein phosphatase [Frankiaceae bacterium]